MGSGKTRWKLSFHRSTFLRKHLTIPTEFLCPISRSLMADPVIVSSGHTFERHCVNACKSLSFTPVLHDGSSPDFSAVIPNLALRSAILNWCDSSLLESPTPIDFLSAEKLVRGLMDSQNRKSRTTEKQAQRRRCDGSDCEVLKEFSESQTTSSEESSVAPGAGSASGPTTPLPLTTRPACYSSSSSSCDLEALHANSLDEDEIVAKLKSSLVFEQEESVISLRKLTRTREETRVQLCTPRILAALRPLIVSRYAAVQVNAAAALVNLSLENRNKVKIVRSGIVPPLINVLKGGSPESQDHAAGALFSLALDDQNKTAIGVLGALPPLLHSLRSESERTRHDAVLALYHLSLVQSNRAKLVKLGSVQALISMVKSGHMTPRILLVLCNLAASPEGRAAMLDGGAVECFVSMLKREDFDSSSTRESCVTALYGLSHGGLRFKGLAKEAGAEEMLMKVEANGSERSRDKARRILEVLRQKDEEDEEVDWEELLNSEDDDKPSS
ncbi:PREDICTED: U-box domain-containing protein 40-like [Ipomoea nil]|uniref:U-box domain-containing protein 40-like n=1 Tax=Ipomoea nil TaxID=35883 RepID=UPI000901FD87|nr:PREDICTED: U-box domain-containing protein 40-like [Ipomoea nil]